MCLVDAYCALVFCLLCSFACCKHAQQSSCQARVVSLLEPITRAHSETVSVSFPAESHLFAGCFELISCQLFCNSTVPCIARSMLAKTPEASCCLRSWTVVLCILGQDVMTAASCRLSHRVQSERVLRFTPDAYISEEITTAGL